VLVFLSIGSRRVEYLACTRNPDTAWMLQQARNLLMGLDDRSRQVRFLVGSPARRRTLHTSVAETSIPSLRSSPTMRT
jgi:hypothetical protein